jgi:hypothetical protein
MTEEGVELGGNIRLSGFSEIDSASMIIVKKLVGTFVKKIADRNPKFQGLILTLKKVHGIEHSRKFELSANLIAERHYNADITDKNLMFAVDKVLKKIEAEME